VVAAENCIVYRVRTGWLVCLASHGMRHLVQLCSVNPSVSRTVFIVHSVNEEADDETECGGCGELYRESSED